MTYFVLAIALIWLGLVAQLLRNLRAAPCLPAVEKLTLTSTPRVSVVIAARDEQARIESCVRRLLGQRGVDLQLIVVDDRSRDATPEILRRLSQQDTRLQLVRIDELPAGWLGKCHACWRGAALAEHSWLLFTDADIHMSSDLLLRAVTVAEQQAADHMALYPGFNCRRALSRAILLAWGQCFLLYASATEINRDRGRRGVGIGAFNLIRRAAYDGIGGHEKLAMEVLDDAKLGMLVRRCGYRQRVYTGYADVEAEWGDDTVGIIRAMEKNWFAGMRFSLLLSAVSIVFVFVMWFGAALGPLVDPVWGWFALAGLLSPIVPGLIQARRARWPWYAALLIPYGLLLFAVGGLHSTFTTLRQGGVRWRDTFYPLAELRAGSVR